MRVWNVKGPLCGGCYSRLIAEFYPGDHVRMGAGGGGGGGGVKPSGGGSAKGDRPDIVRPESAPSGGGSAKGDRPDIVRPESAPSGGGSAKGEGGPPP